MKKLIIFIIVILWAMVTANSFAQDSGLIVYATCESGAWELWRLNPNTLEKSKILTVGGSYITGVAWSPDGSEIAFGSNASGPHEIYVVNADGSGLNQVTTDGGSWPTGNYDPRWEDNEYILYSSSRLNVGQREIVRIKIDGTEQQVLTNIGGTQDSYCEPWLSPDGNQVVYNKGVPYWAASSKVYVADYPAFANQILVADVNGNTGADWLPVWSFNDLIAFYYEDSQRTNVYTVKPDGSVLTNISLVPSARDGRPHFSPDGSRLAFLSDQTGAVNIWSMNVDGTYRRQLTFTASSDVIAQLDWGTRFQPAHMICKAFLTPKRVTISQPAFARPAFGNSDNPKHDFKIHIIPCEPMNVSVGDSAEVYVDVDVSGVFDEDENYPAVVSSTDLDTEAMDIAIKVYVGEGLIDNDPCAAIHSINGIPIKDTLGNEIDYLCLNTFDPHAGARAQTSDKPQVASLGQNYPNPFNPACQIRYFLTRGSEVSLNIYSVTGQKVKTLVKGYQAAGDKLVYWDGTDDGGTNVASGIYFCRIHADDFTEAKKMILMK